MFGKRHLGGQLRAVRSWINLPSRHKVAVHVPFVPPLQQGVPTQARDWSGPLDTEALFSRSSQAGEKEALTHKVLTCLPHGAGRAEEAYN